MIKRGVLGAVIISSLVLIAVILSSLYFVDALVNSGSFSQERITNADIFISPGEQWINVSVNVTRTATGLPSGSVQWVKANFTSINRTACGGDGYLNLSLVNGLWVGNCSVSTFFTNRSQIEPLQGQITFVANDTDETVATTQAGSPSPLTILMHNLGVPNMSDPTGCSRFGNKTTNMSNVNDFSAVNFVVHIQVNFTCQTNGLNNGTSPGLFEDVGLLNLTSLNMTSSDIGDKLSALRNAINVTIGSPRTFEPSRIYVNATAFEELDSAGTVTLYNLPFTSKPGVLNDSGYALAGANWYPGGYSSAKGVNIGNLTFDVLGFSGYNATDNAYPLLSVNTPASGLNFSSGSIVFSTVINGTGTELSYITITNISGGAIYEYNGSSSSTTNSANCVNMSGTNRETWNCTIVFPVAGLSEGTNTVTVSAYDFGGVTGNLNSTTRSITVDRTGPTITVYSPASSSYTKNQTILFNISASDSYTSPSVCWGYVNNTVFSMTKNGSYFNYTNASLGAGVWTLNNFTCNDTLGNIGNISSYTFVVDITAPTSLNITLGTPSSSGVDVHFTSNEEIGSVNLSYGTTTALGSSSLSNAANSTSGYVSLSGLSASTLYYLNVTAYDRAGNTITNGTYSFTTAEAASTGESPASGGGAYGAYIIKDFQLEKGYTKEFAKNGVLKFSSEGESHSLTVKEITNASVTFILASTPQTATLFLGEEKKFDLNADNIYDLSVKLNRISINKIASMTLKSISESATSSEETGEEKAGEETVAGEVPEEKSSIWVFVLIIVGVVIIIGLYFVTKSYLHFRRIH